MFSLFTSPCSSHDIVGRESEIKAAYLFNFLKFVEWSEGNYPDLGNIIRITIVGSNNFGEAFDPLMGKLVMGKKLVISHVESITDLQPSHLIYCENHHTSRLTREVIATSASGTITVGETISFVEQGGIIGFVEKENSIRFAVNLEATRAAGISFSSQLLKLAIIVGDQ